MWTWPEPRTPEMKLTRPEYGPGFGPLNSACIWAWDTWQWRLMRRHDGDSECLTDSLLSVTLSHEARYELILDKKEGQVQIGKPPRLNPPPLSGPWNHQTADNLNPLGCCFAPPSVRYLQGQFRSISIDPALSGQFGQLHRIWVKLSQFQSILVSQLQAGHTRQNARISDRQEPGAKQHPRRALLQKRTLVWTLSDTTHNIFSGKKWLEVNFRLKGKVIYFASSHKTAFTQTLHLMGKLASFRESESYYQGRTFCLKNVWVVSSFLHGPLGTIKTYCLRVARIWTGMSVVRSASQIPESSKRKQMETDRNKRKWRITWNQIWHLAPSSFVAVLSAKKSGFKENSPQNEKRQIERKIALCRTRQAEWDGRREAGLLLERGRLPFCFLSTSYAKTNYESGLSKRCFCQTVILLGRHPPFSSFSSIPWVWGAKSFVFVGRMHYLNHLFSVGDETTVFRNDRVDNPDWKELLADFWRQLSDKSCPTTSSNPSFIVKLDASSDVMLLSTSIPQGITENNEKEKCHDPICPDPI